jgi:hypothetical protein
MLWSPNTQLLYPFENTALDYSGNARHGTVFGSGVYATKPNGGRCLYFDGTGDYVATPSFGLSGTVVVFACWVRCKFNATIRQVLVGESTQDPTGGYIYIQRGANSNVVMAQYANGTGHTNLSVYNYFAAPYDDAWVFCCVVWDYLGKEMLFYRNASLLSTQAMDVGTPVFPATNRAKYVGSYNSSSYLLTDGYLAGVQLWTLATMPAAGQMLANVNRLMLGMNPIW